MRTKALLAIAFAGGVLSAQTEGLCDAPESQQTNSEQVTPKQMNSVSADPVVQQLANNAKMEPEMRAYYLLNVANSYLYGSSQSDVALAYKSTPHELNATWLLNGSSGRPNVVETWAQSLASERLSKGIKDSDSIGQQDDHPLVQRNFGLANRALESAVDQLNQSSLLSAKLTLCLIASYLFLETGNTEGVKQCDKIFEKSFDSFDSKSPFFEQHVIALSTILNLMANNFIFVRIPDTDPKLGSYLPDVKPFTERDFEASERLKLKAIATVDRLAPTDHVRRKAHRDLALWYGRLGKEGMAITEKKKLFELVGTSDEQILYPRSLGCGHLEWWQTDMPETTIDCGRG